MTNNLYQQLSESFPQEMERTINKGGTELTYIPVSEVINRLNKVLGVDRWSFTVQKCERDATDPDFVVALVRIEYQVNDYLVVARDGIGGQKIKRTKSGQIVDLGDEFKGAISDALKKAAQTLGVGLYLARSEDAKEIEQVMETVAPSPEAVRVFGSLVSACKSLSAPKREALNAYWEKISNGASKPRDASDAPLELLESMYAEALRLQFDAETVTTA